MKLVASALKSFRENLRDWKVLVMVLLFSPFFLLIMYLFYGGTPTTYTLGIANQDGGKPSTELVEMLVSKKGLDSIELFKVSHFSRVQDLEAKVRAKTLDVGIVIPRNYLRSIFTTGEKNPVSPSVVQFVGSMSNTRYPVAAVLTADVIQQQGAAAAGITLPTVISETFLEKNPPLNEFHGYVPGLITLAVLMVLFTASASIVKESDKKTLIRLKLSRMGACHFLGGICIVQGIIAAGAIALSYWTALGLGYTPAGSFGAVLFVGALSSLAMVSISLIMASFLRTMFDVLTVGCFPFFLLMFFSGSMFPLPKLTMFTVRGHPLGITDILPLTHTVNAFNSILQYGVGWSGIGFDVAMIILLTVLYAAVGLKLYEKRRLSQG